MRLSIFFTLGFTSWLSATTINVPSDSLTIQSGINGAVNGDTVLVQPGDYIENVDFLGKNIVVGSLTLTTGERSYIAETVIDGNQSGSVVTFTSGEDSTALLHGFTIINGNGTLVSGIQRFGGGIYSYNSSNPTISDCIITGNSAGAGSGGGISCWYASATIKNCIIKNNANHGIFNAFGAGVRVINCLIRDNYASDYGGGIHAGGGSSPTIINCTIVNNDSYHHTSTGIYAISGGTVLNSIVRDNIGPDILIIQGATSVSYSNIEGGYTGIGNIDTDPLFVDSTNNNHRLTDNSPCIGSGLDTILVPMIDLDGNLRPNPPGSNPDIGAYENSLGVPLNESPLTPQDLTATSGNQQVSLTWSLNTESDIWQYKIYRYSLLPTALIDSVFHPDTTYTDTGLTNGLTYHYRISAEDIAGNISTPTDVVNATPNPIVISVKVDGTGDYLTIQSAVDASTSGDTILVYPGIYPDLIMFTDKSVVITSTNGPTETIIHNSVVISNSSSVFTGFTISDQGNGLATGGNQSMTIENNIFKNIDQTAIQVMYGWSNPVIRNNLIDGARFGIVITTYASAEIINNTIVNCTDIALTVRDTATAKIFNTIAWDNAESINWGTNNPPGQVEIYNSNLYGGWSGIGSGNINQDPYFVNPDGKNFHLTNFSPCVGSGLDTSIVPTTDIEGNPRPNPLGSNPDMGVYENALGTPLHNSLIHVSILGNDSASIGLATNPFATIQTAIDYAQNEDTILVNPGTYVENIDFYDLNIVVISTDGPEVTIIDGNQNNSVVIFRYGVTSATVLSGFTVQNGNAYAGGGIDCAVGSNPSLMNLTVSGNTASYEGGGIYCQNSNLSLENVTISGNLSGGRGGGVFCHNSSPVLENVTISGNVATDGGGICFNGPSLGLINTTISGNTADYGGGLYCGSASIDLINTIVWNNSPQEIYFDQVGEPNSITIAHSNVQGGPDSIVTNDNGTVNWGAGNIDVDPKFFNPDNGNYKLLASSLCINAGHPDSTDTDGTRTDMGAYPYLNTYFGPDWYVSNTGNDTTGTGAVDDPFASIQAGINFATTAGDSVSVAAGTFVENINFRGRTIKVFGSNGAENTIIDGNQNGAVITCESGENHNSVLKGFTIKNGYRGIGGGIFCFYGSPSLVDLIIKNNTAIAHGGGISCHGSNPNITNVLITGNTSIIDDGGGIWLTSDSNPVLKNVSIVGNNAATVGGGILCGANSHPSIINSILWNNIPGEIYFYFEPSYAPNTITISYSNIQGGQDSIVTNDIGTVNWLEGNIDVDPRFIDATNDDYNLLASSLCINAGHPDSTDADGTRADMGTCPYINTYTGPDWYVSTNGNDTTAAGSFDNPFASIQAGINFATSADDSVSVAPGTYVENINFRGIGIKVFGEQGAENTIIDGDSSGSVVTFNSGEDTTTILTGFTITNGYAFLEYPDNNGGGILCEASSSPSLKNLIIRGNSATGMGGGLLCTGSSPIIENILISENAAYAGGGIFFSSYSNRAIKNLTITKNQGGGIYSQWSDLIFINTIVWDNSPEEIRLPESSFTISNSDVQGGQNGIIADNGGIIHWLSGNINLYPEFVDSANGDYRLADISSCIARGADSVQIAGTWHYAPNTDLEGNPRPNPAGSNPDMGAYESPVGIPYVVTEVHNLDIGESENISHLITHTPLITFNYYSVLGDPQTQFHVQVSSHSDYSIIDTWDTGETAGNDTAITYSGDILIDGNEYYLRLKVASGEFWSEWSSLEFHMNKIPTTPTPVSPINNQVSNLPIILSALNGTDDGDILTYSFSVYDDIDLNVKLDSIIGLAEGTDTTSWQLVAQLPDNGQYWWTVSSNDGYENSPNSVPESFLLNTDNNSPESFTLIMPDSSTQIETLTPTFTWTPAHDPDPIDTIKYTLYLDTPEPGVELIDCSLDTFYQVLESLLDNQEYHWRVVASDLLGFQSISEGGYRSFSTNMSNEPPFASRMITPTINSIETDLQPLFYWEVAEDPDPNTVLTYTLSFFPNPYPLEGIIPFLIALDSNSYVYDEDLPDNSSMSWTVGVGDGEYFTSGDTILFYTDAFPEAPGGFVLVSPGNDTTGLEGALSFSWEKSVDPDPLDYAEYTLQISSDSTFSEIEYEAFTGVSVEHDIPEGLTTDYEYWWRVIARDADSLRTISDVFKLTVGYVSIAGEVELPTEFVLKQNFPNPFNPSTTVIYGLPESSDVRVTVYNLIGQEVATLVNEYQPAGWYETIWNGIDESGQIVPTGIYFTRLEGGPNSQVVKMLYLK